MKEGEEGEEEEEEEYSWTLDDDEREIKQTEWVEGVIHMAFNDFQKPNQCQNVSVGCYENL